MGSTKEVSVWDSGAGGPPLHSKCTVRKSKGEVILVMCICLFYGVNVYLIMFISTSLVDIIIFKIIHNFFTVYFSLHYVFSLFFIVPMLDLSCLF